MTNRRLKPVRFFMVCRNPVEVIHNNPKTVKYTLDEAKQHAENLVRETGHVYFVLASIAMVVPTSPPVEWTVIE